jgi:hypothetical protein
MKFFLVSMLSLFLSQNINAAQPLWTIIPSPSGSNIISIGINDIATINYIVTNKSNKNHTLFMQPITGISQNISSGNCPNPFNLQFNQSCRLALTVKASELPKNVNSGPIICDNNSPLQCYQPSNTDSLKINVGKIVYITPNTSTYAFQTATPTGSGSFVTGPVGEPNGSPGSIQLTVGDPNTGTGGGGEIFSTNNYAGTLYANIKGLTYTSYTIYPTLTPDAPSINLDFDSGEGSISSEGFAVFTPGVITPSIPIQAGVWQTWDPMTQNGWYGTRPPLQNICSLFLPVKCTLAQILLMFPNAKIHAIGSPNNVGIFGFKIGNTGSPAIVSVGSYTLGTMGADGPITTYLYSPLTANTHNKGLS